jgi:hypothetical protein
VRWGVYRQLLPLGWEESLEMQEQVGATLLSLKVDEMR